MSQVNNVFAIKTSKRPLVNNQNITIAYNANIQNTSQKITNKKSSDAFG